VLPANSFQCKCFCKLYYFYHNTATVSSYPSAYFRTGNLKKKNLYKYKALLYRLFVKPITTPFVLYGYSFPPVRLESWRQEIVILQYPVFQCRIRYCVHRLSLKFISKVIFNNHKSYYYNFCSKKSLLQICD
jgi:hypothetical protein